MKLYEQFQEERTTARRPLKCFLIWKKKLRFLIKFKKSYVV
jgi:hypothetical protein